MLSSGSRDKGLSATSGWLHVPSAASFSCNSKMANLLGHDHPHCLATCWPYVRLSQLLGFKKKHPQGRGYTSKSARTQAYRYHPTSEAGIGPWSTSVRTAIDIISCCIPMHHAHSFQSACGLRSASLKLTGHEMLSHHYLSSALAFTLNCVRQQTRTGLQFILDTTRTKCSCVNSNTKPLGTLIPVTTITPSWNITMKKNTCK